MKNSIRDFIGALIILLEVLGAILLWGIVGGLEQCTLTIAQGAIMAGAIILVMGLLAVPLYILIKTDTRA